jgi:hypothetical protein
MGSLKNTDSKYLEKLSSSIESNDWQGSKEI